MNRRIAFPFLVLSEAAVHADPWLISLNDGEFMQAATTWQIGTALRPSDFSGP